MALFLPLPEELIVAIVSFMDQTATNAVCRVNKTAHRIAIPMLYRLVDLRISSDNKLPRIDRFCLSIFMNADLAKRVKILQIGPSPYGDINNNKVSRLEDDTSFDNQAVIEKTQSALNSDPLASSETLARNRNALKAAIGRREYMAYATVIFFTLPSLQEFDFADYSNSSPHILHSIFEILNPGPAWARRILSQGLLKQLSSIKKVSYNFNKDSGAHHTDDKRRLQLDRVFCLPGLRTADFSIEPGQAAVVMDRLFRTARPCAVTVIVIRHSTYNAQLVSMLLQYCPKLESLTYDMFWDKHERSDAPLQGIDLDQWSKTLLAVKDTLKTLAIAVEYCDTSSYPFDQPKIGNKIRGCLDLTGLHKLTSLEVPIPFLTGDLDCSITANIRPKLPISLQNLSLRLDLSHAQHWYPLDTAVLDKDPTRAEATFHANFAMQVRMDMSYMFYATLRLLELLTRLRKITVWQPADPAMSWFPGQIDDFTNVCKKQSVSGHLMFPTFLRLGDPDQRDLVKEVTVHDRWNPRFGHGERMCSETRNGIPLGLATQYHIRALKSHRVLECNDSDLFVGAPSDPDHMVID